MKLFEFIRQSLKKIGFRASYIPKEDTFGLSTPDTVKEDEHKIVRERVRKAFAEQEKEMTLRASKIHSVSCVDNWTCTKEPCYIPEPDKIVKHRKNCVHFNGVIITLPMCECGLKYTKIKDKDFPTRY